MIRIVLTLCFVVVLLAPPCFAEEPSQEQSAVQVPPTLLAQNPTAWQNIKDFDDTALFAVAGPPTQEDAERAKADTQLYEDMVNNFDELEDEDDDYLFVIEALFDPEDSSRPASLRMDDDDVDDNIDEATSTPNLTSSIYIDTVRPTFFPGFQIKPRALDPDKKDNADARSLFADLNKPRADDILNDEKPIIPGEPPVQAAVPVLPGTTKDAADAAEKAGKINAPPKAAAKRPLSPDEETLGALKEAVKELGLENKLNLGKGAGGHQALESNEEVSKEAPPTGAALDVAQQKRTPLTAKQRAYMKKKMRKAQQPRRRVKPVEAQPEAAPPPPKESGGLLDDLF